MPLGPGRVGRVGVIGHPVAKTAVVAKAVTPGPAPVAALLKAFDGFVQNGKAGAARRESV